MNARPQVAGDLPQRLTEIVGERGIITAAADMSTFDATALTLSQSFRFGAAVATEANRWLAIAGQPLRITGTPAITSTVTTPTGMDNRLATDDNCAL